MARPLRIEYAGAFYHVTSRGNEGRKIFDFNADRERFLSYLKEAHQRFKIMIHAYCLMDNHYHLLVETPLANLSRGMQMINSGYTTYYNFKNKRLGHLFQGRYKAILVEKDSYAQQLSRYIHLNPVRTGTVSRPEEYPWSSYRYYTHSKETPAFLTSEFILTLFSNKRYEGQKDYKSFVEEGLSKEMVNPLKGVTAGLILGSHGFVQEIKDKYLDRSKKSRDLPSLRELKKDYASAEDIISFLQDEDALTERECLKIMAYLLRKHTGETLEEISRRLSNRMSAAAISQSFSRLEKKRGRDRNLNKKLEVIKGKLFNVEV